MRIKKTFSYMLVLNMLIYLLSGCGNADGQPEDKGRIQQTGNAEQRTITAGAQRILETYGAESESPVRMEREMAYLIYSSDLYSEETYRKIKVERDEEIDNIPILMLEFRDRSDKEERINRLLMERYEKVLPMDKEWLDSAEIRITYRSDRYLCFEYDCQRVLPEGYDRRDLIFTLDVEKEQLVEYPAAEELCDEKREWQQLSVEEQSERRGGTQYRLYEDSFLYENYQIPCIQIRGVGDEVREYKINEQLSAPLQNLLEAVPDEQRDRCGMKFSEEMSLYVAYQTEEYLSVVYSVQYGDFSKTSGGIAHIGITIDMKTGERVMLDDLFDLDGLIGWICLYSGGDETSLRDDIIKGSVLSEAEYVELYKDDNTFLMTDCVDRRDSFYLYQGMIVILNSYDFYHFEEPLPEIYEYLKTDPWY